MATTTTLTNGYVNGQKNGVVATAAAVVSKRFSDIPSALDIPVSGEAEEAVELNLDDLLDDPTELCTLLENENASKTIWLTIALAYAKSHMIDLAIEICNRGLQSLSRNNNFAKDRIGLLSLQCWLYIWKSREAPRVAPEGVLTAEAMTKDYYLQQATGVLNEASRVNPSFPPLFLARGVLSLLRASFQASATSMIPGGSDQSERTERLRQALKCFDDASRVSHGRNMMAALGKARTLFALRRYEESLSCYQDVLSKVPDLHDPDPRIGIGCCLWQLNHPQEARLAWQRALDFVSCTWRPRDTLLMVL